MRRGGADRTARALLALVTCLVAMSCTNNPYYIGDVCPGADGGVILDGGCPANAGITFAVDLDKSGVSRLNGDLELPSGPVRPALRLRGEYATMVGWPAEQGGALGRDTSVPQLGLEAPFTDETRAVGMPDGAPTYVAASSAFGAVGGDDFAVEIVLRAAAGATLLYKLGTAGWTLLARADGALELALADDAPQRHQALVATEPLIEGAWYHCLFWVSRSAGGRADCNGRTGVPVDLSLVGNADSPAVAALGGGAVVRVALLAIYRVPARGLGEAAGWRAIGAQRFAALTGVRPRVARGSALPREALRTTPAYLDLQSAPGAPRRLFLVGPDWPRIACRTDTADARDCGYLSEPNRVRVVPPDPSNWRMSELGVLTFQELFADGTTRFEALVPSTTNAPHTLTLVGPNNAVRHAFSFFVRAGGSGLIGVTAGNGAMAIFDLRAGTVMSMPAAVQATLEQWGDGVFRCAYVFDAPPGPTTYTLHLLSAAGTTPFAGDGATAAVYVTGLQVDVGLPYPGSLMASDLQDADRLTFVADDGNLPAKLAVSIGLRVLLPAGPRLTDQAVFNLNQGGSFEDQVQLFVTGNTGTVRFWGLRAGVTHWTVDHPTPALDGKRHLIQAAWNDVSAQVGMDGVVATLPPSVPIAAPLVLDRIDVGFSNSSSGHLEGLVAGLQIASP